MFLLDPLWLNNDNKWKGGKNMSVSFFAHLLLLSIDHFSTSCHMSPIPWKTTSISLVLMCLGHQWLQTQDNGCREQDVVVRNDQKNKQSQINKQFIFSSGLIFNTRIILWSRALLEQHASDRQPLNIS